MRVTSCTRNTACNVSLGHLASQMEWSSTKCGARFDGDIVVKNVSNTLCLLVIPIITPSFTSHSVLLHIIERLDCFFGHLTRHRFVLVAVKLCNKGV